MLELPGAAFLGAITDLRALTYACQSVVRKDTDVTDSDKKMLLALLERLMIALEQTYARSALAPATRLRNALNSTEGIKFERVGVMLGDIESRFADHLRDIKLFVLNQGEATLFDPADALLAFQGRPVEGFSRAFPNAAFEIEEAAKCIALERHTACVFHCMRALECAIKALCKCLEIPDAVKPAEKNWGHILKNILEAINEKWPKNTRISGSKGSEIEKIYATLDAIKNPWRNATMHVETIYAPHEAIHIARCTGMFLLELMKHCDEEGRAPMASPAQATVGAST